MAFDWHPGFARVQKEKNVKALHDAAVDAGYSNVLEVSTKSESKRGRHLSAFHLHVSVNGLGEASLESVFQGSKVFQRGGPYTDLFEKEPRDAKRDERLRTSGALVAFKFRGFEWPLEPKTAFYDWLYASCIYPHRDWAQKLAQYSGFSDIEFNPARSINCQARSIALFLSLMRRNELDEAMRTPESFLAVLERSAYRPALHECGNGHGELDFPKQGLFEVGIGTSLAGSARTPHVHQSAKLSATSVHGGH